MTVIGVPGCVMPVPIHNVSDETGGSFRLARRGAMLFATSATQPGGKAPGFRIRCGWA